MRPYCRRYLEIPARRAVSSCGSPLTVWRWRESTVMTVSSIRSGSLLMFVACSRYSATISSWRDIGNVLAIRR
jgi:hypothetical protein